MRKSAKKWRVFPLLPFSHCLRMKEMPCDTQLDISVDTFGSNWNVAIMQWKRSLYFAWWSWQKIRTLTNVTLLKNRQYRGGLWCVKNTMYLLFVAIEEKVRVSEATAYWFRPQVCHYQKYSGKWGSRILLSNYPSRFRCRWWRDLQVAVTQNSIL